MLWVKDILFIQSQIPEICKQIGIEFYTDAGRIRHWAQDPDDLLDGYEYNYVSPSPTMITQITFADIRIQEYRMFFNWVCKLQKIEKWGPEKDNRGYLVQDTSFTFDVNKFNGD